MQTYLTETRSSVESLQSNIAELRTLADELDVALASVEALLPGTPDTVLVSIPGS